MADVTGFIAVLDGAVQDWRDGTYSHDEYEDVWYEKQYAAAVVTCVHCKGTWHPESEEPFASWSAFHAGCAEAPCDHCGKPTNTPDACFDCYHAPFGIGWEQDMEQRFAGGW